MIRKPQQPSDGIAKTAIPVIAVLWALVTFAVGVIELTLPDWLSWTAPAAEEVPVSAPPASRTDGCQHMPGGLRVCNDPMPPRR